jgi:hypothetical protein
VIFGSNRPSPSSEPGNDGLATEHKHPSRDRRPRRRAPPRGARGSRGGGDSSSGAATGELHHGQSRRPARPRFPPQPGQVHDDQSSESHSGDRALRHQQSGQIVGGYDTPGFIFQGFLLDRGRYKTIGSPGPCDLQRSRSTPADRSWVTTRTPAAAATAICWTRAASRRSTSPASRPKPWAATTAARSRRDHQLRRRQTQRLSAGQGCLPAVRLPWRPRHQLTSLEANDLAAVVEVVRLGVGRRERVIDRGEHAGWHPEPHSQRLLVAAAAGNLARAHGANVTFVYQHALKRFAARLSSDRAAALAADPRSPTSSPTRSSTRETPRRGAPSHRPTRSTAEQHVQLQRHRSGRSRVHHGHGRPWNTPGVHRQDGQRRRFRWRWERHERLPRPRHPHRRHDGRNDVRRGQAGHDPSGTRPQLSGLGDDVGSDRRRQLGHGEPRLSSGGEHEPGGG